MKVEFDPLAVHELNDAVDYYNSRFSGLGERFKQSIQSGIKKIVEYPEAWQNQTARSRRFILNTFPYKIIYVYKPDIIYIIAIAHSHRRPDYWVDRIDV